MPGTLACWPAGSIQARPTSRAEPQAEGPRWGGPSHPSCREEGTLKSAIKGFLARFPHLDPIHRGAITGTGCRNLARGACHRPTVELLLCREHAESIFRIRGGQQGRVGA